MRGSGTAQREGTTTILYVSLYTEMGGGEYGLLYLLTHLDRRKYHPIVMFNAEGPLKERLDSLGIETVIMPFDVVMLQQLISPPVFLRNAKASVEIARYIKRRKIDLIQCSDVLSLLLLAPALFMKRIPVIYSVIFFYERARALVLNLLAFLGVKYIATLSRMLRDDLAAKTYGVGPKMELIYWGVDLSRFTPRSQAEREGLRATLGLPQEKKIIGFIGRYEVWKGHLTFLDAAAGLCRRRSDLLFLVVGGAMTGHIIPAVARYRERVLRRIHELGLDEHVTVWEHRDDVPEIMASLDLFVCPSDREPFGLVVLEALACGIPAVVGSRVGALEVLEGEPMVFVAEPGNAGAFTQQIEAALRLGVPPLQPSVDIRRCDWQTYTREYEKLYERARGHASSRKTPTD